MTTTSRALSERRTRRTTVMRHATYNGAGNGIRKTRANRKWKLADLKSLTAPRQEQDDDPSQAKKSVPFFCFSN